jgi:hypothetical protein
VIAMARSRHPSESKWSQVESILPASIAQPRANTHAPQNKGEWRGSNPCCRCHWFGLFWVPRVTGWLPALTGMTHNFTMSVPLKADVGTDMPRSLLNANHLIAPRQISPLSDHIGGAGNQ